MRSAYEIKNYIYQKRNTTNQEPAVKKIQQYTFKDDIVASVKISNSWLLIVSATSSVWQNAKAGSLKMWSFEYKYQIQLNMVSKNIKYPGEPKDRISNKNYHFTSNINYKIWAEDKK